MAQTGNGETLSRHASVAINDMFLMRGAPLQVGLPGRHAQKIHMV